MVSHHIADASEATALGKILFLAHAIAEEEGGSSGNEAIAAWRAKAYVPGQLDQAYQQAKKYREDEARNQGHDISST